MNATMYAVKKRKKPVQKIPKASPPDGAKTNPSKRHRDRLNGELEKLTSLLPFSEEVRARLDKLSVLRLSVGYLKVKSFFNATLKKGPGAVDAAIAAAPALASVLAPALGPTQPQVTSIDGVSFSEGDLLLKALNGFVLVVTAEGYVFYTSPTIQDYLGFHQSDVVHQSVFELIHTEDRALFRQQLHFALNPNTSTHDQSSADISTSLVAYEAKQIPQENTSFLERNFCCRFRCLLDNSSGFLALNFYGRLKFLHGQQQHSVDGAPVPPQLALFALVMPLQPPSILEIRTKTLLFQTKHKLDFTPTDIDSRGQLILGYTESELRAPGSGYHFVHAADMMYCADQHLRMMKTGVSGFTVFRLLSKQNSWKWVQSNARLVFKGGKPDFIITRMKALTAEEGEENLRQRRLQLPFSSSSGEAQLYDLAPTISPPATEPQEQCSAPKQRKTDYSVTPNSILGSLLGQDQSLYCSHSTNISSVHNTAFGDSQDTFSINEALWSEGPSSTTTLVKTESSVQDMVDTLQQVLGDSNLVSSLGVEPEELRSWESTIMSLNDSSFDLNSALSRDILTFVEEQFQKEGGFHFLEDIPTVLPSLDHTNQSPEQVLLQDLPLDLLNDIIPKTEPPQNSFRLGPKESTLNGTVPLFYSDPNPNPQTYVNNGPGQAPVTLTSPQTRVTRETPAPEQLLSGGGLPPPLRHPEVGGLYTQTPLQQGVQWSCPVPPQVGAYSSSMSEHKTGAWSHPNGHHHISGAQQMREPLTSSCMFSPAPSTELHTESSRAYCMYQHTEVQNRQMSCSNMTVFSLDSLLSPAQTFHFEQQSKMNTMGNGGFSLSSVPNGGGTYCSKNQ